MYRNQSQRDFARELRRNATPAEKALWHHLRAQKLGVKFRRQAAIGAYIVDFVCFSCRLVIELDGPQHLDPQAIDHDQHRSQWLTSRGFKVIRFRNQELDENIWEVVKRIQETIREVETSGVPAPSPALPASGREPNRD